MRIQREGLKLPPVNVYKGGIQRHLLAQQLRKAAQPHSLWPQGCFISGHLAAPRISFRQPIRLVLLRARKEIGCSFCFPCPCLSNSVRSCVICPEPKLLGATRLPNKTPAHKRPQRCPQAHTHTSTRKSATALPEDARNTDAHKARKMPATPTSARRPKQHKTLRKCPQGRTAASKPRRPENTARNAQQERHSHVSIWEDQF